MGLLKSVQDVRKARVMVHFSRKASCKAAPNCLEPRSSSASRSCLSSGGCSLSRRRIASGLIEQRTAKANQIRGLVAEYGLVAPKELLMLRRAIPCWLEEADNGLTVHLRRLLDGGATSARWMSVYANSTATYLQSRQLNQLPCVCSSYAGPAQ